MKSKFFLFTIFLTGLLASCMDSGYDTPTEDYTGAQIDTTNILPIQDVKDKYKSTINGSGMSLVNEDIQIKGWVTGNDQGSNLYNEIAVQDNSGAIIVSISQSGLYGYFAEGQQVVINLKGLYIGGYGSQAQIGGVYTNARTGATSIGGMDRYTWPNHIMLVGKPDPDAINRLISTFDYSKSSNSNYIWENQGKLMELNNVTFKNGDGKSVFAPKNDPSVTLTNNSANRGFVGMSDSRLVFRTSTYAKFAADTIPQGKTRVVGIFTVYRNTWQILARSRSDAYGTTGTYYDK